MSTMLQAPRLDVQRFTADDYVGLAAECFPWMSTTHAAATGEFYARMGVAWTLRWGGRLVLGAGVLFPYGTSTLAVAWAVWTSEARRWPVRRHVHVTVVRGLRRVVAHFKPLRVQAEILASSLASERWVDHLGFAHESTMPHYGPHGETMETWVWFPSYSE
jgi:hypothetical protein